MLEMLKGRNLINFIGIPMWLLLIYKGGLYYCIFILACSAFALGEFYSIMEKKEPSLCDGWVWLQLYS